MLKFFVQISNKNTYKSNDLNMNYFNLRNNISKWVNYRLTFAVRIVVCKLTLPICPEKKFHFFQYQKYDIIILVVLNICNIFIHNVKLALRCWSSHDMNKNEELDQIMEAACRTLVYIYYFSHIEQANIYFIQMLNLQNWCWHCSRFYVNANIQG